MGGVKTDLDGRTDVPGLYAVGECASTGVHGANRLASNSLLEAIVFGTRAAGAIASVEDRAPGQASIPALPTELNHDRPSDLGGLRNALAEKVGMQRTEQSLQQALDYLEDYPCTTVGGRLARLTAELIAASAKARQESRGAHQRADWPQTADRPQHTVLRYDAERRKPLITFEETT
jgi:L-aspartate oxidase